MKQKEVADVTYLITKDLVEKLRNKYEINLSESLSAQVKRLGDEFVDRFWLASGLPKEIDKLSLDAGELSSKLKALLNGASFYISLDKVYFPKAPAYLEVTRRTDQTTGKVELSERPGNKPLVEQLDSLSGYRKVSLTDVGAFSGDTLMQICSMFEARGVRISRVYLGVSSYELTAKANTRVKFNVVKQFNFYEWIELRDLLGIDGRAVGLKDGIRTYMPYWENLKEWASIPNDAVGVTAKLCKEYGSCLLGLIRGSCSRSEERIGEPVKYLKGA